MMPAAIIAEKRDGRTLSAQQIADFVQGFTAGTIPDYQMSALAMAIFCRGMNSDETAALTDAMLQSGDTLHWPGADNVVDKHSTGGVGDKVSLVLAPLLASAGLRVPMISGRGLGPTGGTLDKLESISGFRTDLSIAELQQVTNRVGAVITGATAQIAPADKQLYALRDVTATVESIPLITASIMSKKLAEGLNALVLDVKFGSGAFMKTRQQAQQLAHSLVATGHRMGVATTALITDMNQPLGRMIGNAVEVDEAVATLSGQGPADVRKLTLALGSELLVATGRAADAKAAGTVLARLLDGGAGLEKFHAMVAAQGGDLEAPRPLAPAVDWPSPASGFVTEIVASRLGQAVIALGGGRRVMTDAIDHGVGIEMLVQTGDAVSAGQPLMRVLARDRQLSGCQELLQASLTIGDAPPTSKELIAGRIGAAESAYGET